MRPFSLFTYVLRVIWDGVPVLVWMGFAYLVFSEVRSFGIQVELAAPIAAFALWVIMRLLRPLRKLFNMKAYFWMLLTPFKPLTELGIWKLLLVNERYWPQELPLYEGTMVFAAAYQRRAPKGQHLINGILWKVDLVGKAHLAKAARGFMREVKTALPPQPPQGQ